LVYFFVFIIENSRSKKQNSVKKPTSYTSCCERKKTWE